MPKKAVELSALRVKQLSTVPGRHAVGGVAGLCLLVPETGRGASWILRMTIGLKRPEYGCGSYPQVGLSDARERARTMRTQLEQGEDPRIAKAAAKQKLRVDLASAVTFMEAATQCHAGKSAGFANKKHSDQWINTLIQYAGAAIGKKRCSDVTSNDIHELLEPLWTTKTETATRVRQRIETVLDFAGVKGWRDKSIKNPASWTGNLEHLLPAPGKVRQVKHFPSLPVAQLPHFMRDLRSRPGTAARCLEFAILTTTRNAEARGACWNEIDFKNRRWTIPKERMKAKKLKHTVPLCEAAVRLLMEIPRFGGTDLIFPSPKGAVMSENTLGAVIERMEPKSEVVPHGFRSTFKDWARALNKYLDEVSELALAHVNSDETRAAYARDELLPLRTSLMAEWGTFCDSASTNDGAIAVAA